MPVLAYQNLKEVINGVKPMITAVKPINEKDQIQMASVDLILGDRVHCIRQSATPRLGEPVQALIDQYTKHEFGLSESEDKILHARQTYVVPLNEGLCIPKGYSAKFSPKSSIGRIDVFVRIIANGIPHYDRIPDEYEGPLYLVITPLSFDILVRAGQPLVQMRIRDGEAMVPGNKIPALQSKYGLVWNKSGQPLNSNTLNVTKDGLYMHVDFDRKIVGWVAKRATRAELVLSRKNAHEIEDFWEPIKRVPNGELTIHPDWFYLFATRERIKIPPHICGDIAPSDSSQGEFRSHYAGFFDPGFGGSRPEDKGTVGVMEVRGREIPQRLTDGSPICRMDFEYLTEEPKRLYGEGSHYTGAGPSLSKFFRRAEKTWEA